MLNFIRELDSFTAYGLSDLLAWACDRHLRYGFEPSVRLQAEQFEVRRGLFTFAIGDLGSEASQEVAAICHVMRMPDELLQSLLRFFSVAAFVHFGFECSGEIMTGKCYLELPARGTGEWAVAGRLQFLGFKWSISDSSVRVVTRYRTRQLTEHGEQESLMLLGIEGRIRDELATLIKAVRSTPASAGPGSITLLQIEEEGSDRKSWDWNVYDHALRLREVQDRLLAVAEAIVTPRESVQCWLNENADEVLGHLACGKGRDGQPFLTIYYGAASLQ